MEKRFNLMVKFMEMLNLKGLCLQGTLAPEIGKLTNIKSTENQQLEELEILDLGYNNFSGSFLSDITSHPSLRVLLLDNNDYLANLNLEVNKLKTISEVHANEEQLSGATIRLTNLYESLLSIIKALYVTFLFQDRRQLLKMANAGNTPKTQEDDDNENVTLSPSSLPSSLPPDSGHFWPSPLSISPSELPSNSPLHQLHHHYIQLGFSTFPSSYSSHGNTKNSNSKQKLVIIWSTVGSFSLLILASDIAFAFLKNCKVVTVKPWATALSGQLQKAFVSDTTVYKGTLSSGAEIAVVVPTAMSPKNWSKYMESQFRKKIEALSRVNHKNFLNLIGFCKEKKPFTRMVFEYAQNGTLFEHLHIKESEHLDWGMRMRIAMGIAFCLEHMHQLTPPIAIRNLLSSSVYLTEDCAAKIS
ncbi:hypothetical protein L6164_026097 [Bauhinia variegata]|uniref:Uncharacterized protein n=1 Tax=Bauhinia variegata TaxID=167791 RepID=A0ACB9M2Q2_BAUVA|nr:hypothetical protein L6164_026097 [Bauhinia variegata]